MQHLEPKVTWSGFYNRATWILTEGEKSMSLICLETGMCYKMRYGVPVVGKELVVYGTASGYLYQGMEAQALFDQIMATVKGETHNE